jgi:RimJ/RimL family protein N-acetyltransferase
VSKNLIVFDQDPVFLNYAGAQLGIQYLPEIARTVSHVRQNDDGSLTMLAVVVLSHWTTHSVEISIASNPGLWATKRFIRAVYEYAFGHCGKERIHMLVEHENAESIEMHKRLGHKYEGQLDDWFGVDKPALIYGLTKRNYLNSKWSHKNEKGQDT